LPNLYNDKNQCDCLLDTIRIGFLILFIFLTKPAVGEYERLFYLYPDSMKIRKKGIAKKVDEDLTWRHDSARLSER